jgi:hypothetical protein
MDFFSQIDFSLEGFEWVILVTILIIAIFTSAQTKKSDAEEGTIIFAAFAIPYLIFATNQIPAYPSWITLLGYPGAWLMAAGIKKWLRNSVYESLSSHEQVQWTSKDIPGRSSIAVFLLVAVLVNWWAYDNFNERLEQSNVLYKAGYDIGYQEGCSAVINYFGNMGVMYYEDRAYSVKSCLQLKDMQGIRASSSPQDLTQEYIRFSAYDLSGPYTYHMAKGEKAGFYNAAHNIFQVLPYLCYGSDCVDFDRFYDYYYPEW